MAALPHHHCALVRTLDFQGKALAQLAEHSDRLFCWFFIVLRMSFFTGLLIIVDANPIRGIRKGQFPYNYSLAWWRAVCDCCECVSQEGSSLTMHSMSNALRLFCQCMLIIQWNRFFNCCTFSHCNIVANLNSQPMAGTCLQTETLASFLCCVQSYSRQWPFVASQICDRLGKSAFWIAFGINY